MNSNVWENEFAEIRKLGFNNGQRVLQLRVNGNRCTIEARAAQKAFERMYLKEVGETLPIDVSKLLGG